MSNQSPETRLTILETQRQADEDWRARTDRTLESIAESFKLLARIEAQNNSLAEALKQNQALLKSYDERLNAVELELPSLKEARSGVMRAVYFVLAAVGAAVLALVGLKSSH